MQLCHEAITASLWLLESFWNVTLARTMIWDILFVYYDIHKIRCCFKFKTHPLERWGITAKAWITIVLNSWCLIVYLDACAVIYKWSHVEVVRHLYQLLTHLRSNCFWFPDITSTDNISDSPQNNLLRTYVDAMTFSIRLRSQSDECFEKSISRLTTNLWVVNR